MPKHAEEFLKKIGAREDRKNRAELRGRSSIWVGLAMFGRVGWAVAVPGLLGVVLGAWLDNRYPSSYSWALMLLGAGIGIGCFNAWGWLQTEHERIKRDAAISKDSTHE